MDIGNKLKTARMNCNFTQEYVAEKIGEIRGRSIEEVAEKSRENAKRLFGI